MRQVDDLEDIGALEEYIAYSQMILIFLSQGYFRSKNCLREVRTSLDRQKPLVLVQEVNPEKGGGTLQVRASCSPLHTSSPFPIQPLLNVVAGAACGVPPRPAAGRL